MVQKSFPYSAELEKDVGGRKREKISCGFSFKPQEEVEEQRTRRSGEEEEEEEEERNEDRRNEQDERE